MDAIHEQIFDVTVFLDRGARKQQRYQMTLVALAEICRITTAGTESGLSFLKLATFGDVASEKGCLRTRVNMKGATGVEVATTGLAFDGIVAALKTANVCAVVTTKWDGALLILAPLSQAVLPEDREKQVARINGLLGGRANPDSFVASEAHQLGHLIGGTGPRVELIEGRFIDVCEDLDAQALGKGEDPETNAEIARLALLPRLAYEQAREEARKQLRVRAGVLDKLVETKRRSLGNAENVLPSYAEVAEETLRRIRKRNGEDLLRVADDNGVEHLWRCRGHLWALLAPADAVMWIEQEIELALREMKRSAEANAKYVFEAYKYIVRSPALKPLTPVVWDNHGKIPTYNELIDPVTLRATSLWKLDYVTWNLDIVYDPKAECPLWLELLEDSFKDADEHDTRLVLLQDFFGTTLINTLPKRLRRALVLLGASDCGKTVLLRILGAMLSNKPIATTFKELEGPHGLQEFIRRAPWILDEAFDVGVWHLSARVKSLISGDPQSINPKNRPPITMPIRPPCAWGSNHAPTFKENTEAMINRLLIVPMSRVFRRDEHVGVAAKAFAVNPSWEPFDLILDRERAGILNWMIAGLQRVLARGYFANTIEGENALDEVRLNANVASGFIRDCIGFSGKMMLSTADFHAAFLGWRREHHGDEKVNLSRTVVGNHLKALAHPRIAQDKQAFRKRDGTRFYLGIFLNTEGQRHFTETRQRQHNKPEPGLGGMSGSAAAANQLISEDWLTHPKVKKLETAATAATKAAEAAVAARAQDPEAADAAAAELAAVAAAEEAAQKAAAEAKKHAETVANLARNTGAKTHDQE